MEAALEAERGHIVGKRCLGGAKQGQENRGNGARRTETRVSYDLEAIFSLLYIGSGKTKRKGRMGKERGRKEEKASPTLSGEGPKACAIPSGWSRDGFGMESGTRTSGFLMQEKRLSNRTQIGLKSGVKNEVNFVAL